MALVRAMDEFPPLLCPVMKNIFLFFESPRTASGPLKMFLDYEWLPKRDASLMCLSIFEAELPPHKLQFDLQGSICIKDEGLIIKVKSSPKREFTPLHVKCFYLLALVAEFGAGAAQLERLILLLALALRNLFPPSPKMIRASGEVYAPFASADERSPVREPDSWEENDLHIMVEYGLVSSFK